MARKTNYAFEKNRRAREKAAKREAKLEAKREARERKRIEEEGGAPPGEDGAVASEPTSDDAPADRVGD